MKLILLDGGPASGKNTLGEILVENFNLREENAVLLDMDFYVEEICPTWIWMNEQQKAKDLENARENFIKSINKSLKEGFNVVAIGERFLTREDVEKYVGKLVKKVDIYLYHLSVPFALRKQRLNDRGPHSLINLEKDQEDRDAVAIWPGYVYQNLNSPKVDGLRLMELIEKGMGHIV